MDTKQEAPTGIFIVPKERLLLHLGRIAKPLKGDRQFLELLYHPNQRIHSSQLKNLFNEQGKGTKEFESMADFEEKDGISIGYGWCELPIEITDRHTLHDCWLRLKQLAREEESVEDWNDFGRLQDIRDERQWILDFIKECVTASGKIKCLSNKQYDDYRSVLKTLNRSIRQIAIDEPDLIPYINEHLHIGVYCVWQEAI